MSINIEAQLLASTLHTKTLLRELVWHTAPLRMDGENQASRLLRYETTLMGFRFSLCQYPQLRPFQASDPDCWVTRSALSILDEQGNEIWQESDSRMNVTGLYRLVQRRLTCVDDVFKALVRPHLDRPDQRTERFEGKEAGVLPFIRRFTHSFVARFM